jgi:hypothetical protein
MHREGDDEGMELILDEAGEDEAEMPDWPFMDEEANWREDRETFLSLFARKIHTFSPPVVLATL